MGVVVKIFLIAFFVLEAASMLFADGAEVFNKYKCAVCHGEKAEKKSLGKSEVIAGWRAEKIVKALKEYKAKTRNKYNFGSMMSGKAVKLNETEMNEVAQYIQTLAPLKEENPLAEEIIAPLEPVQEVSEQVEEKPAVVSEEKPTIEYVEYVVKNSDTLASISRNRYQNLYFWPLIYMKNKEIIKNQDVIAPGTVIYIPDTVDMQKKENVALVTESYIAAYKNYKGIGKAEDARWLIYTCHVYVNPKVLDDYKNMIDAYDMDKVRYYIKRFSK